jgi:uncharacterized protein YegL
MEIPRTELVFILDKSGSMAGLESDTLGGFNAMLKRQKKEPGEAVVTTVLFNHEYTLLHDRTDINGVKEISESEYQVGGSTALLDAIGFTVDKIVKAHRNTPEDKRPENVLFVIITDGMENSSSRYTSTQIKQLIEFERERFGWEFLFLGANIDAVETAAGMGILANRASRYHADSMGTTLNYEAVNRLASRVRCNQPIEDDWDKEIAKDYHDRTEDRQ